MVSAISFSAVFKPSYPAVAKSALRPGDRSAGSATMVGYTLVEGDSAGGWDTKVGPGSTVGRGGVDTGAGSVLGPLIVPLAVVDGDFGEIDRLRLENVFLIGRVMGLSRPFLCEDCDI